MNFFLRIFLYDKFQATEIDLS